MISKMIGLLAALCVILCIAAIPGHAGTLQQKGGFAYPEIFKKKTLTIAVTDSGLGGLSVVADAARKLQHYRGFETVEIIFFNALFSSQGGYNSLSDRDEKIAVFNSALESLEKKYTPDLILIACNTLSVIYPDTRFAARTQTPVKGIVEDGVEMVEDQIKDTESSAILFATPTTVAEGLHKKMLEARGIDEDQIFYQACPELTLFIEQGYDSVETQLLIQAYVDEALSDLEGKKQSVEVVAASFNCTHFGYSAALWKQAFEAHGITDVTFLDPNYKMINNFLVPSFENRYPETHIRICITSMVPISQDRMDSIGRYLNTVSKITAKALFKYELVPNLFNWQGLIKDRLN